MSENLPLQLVVELARSIPCSPWLLPQLMQLLDDPHQSDAQHIQFVMMKDSGLVSSVLRMANSAAYSMKTRCESVAEAVLRIGFREVYRLTVNSVAGRWLNQPEKGYGWQPGDLCKHSLCVAVAAEILARESGKVNPNLAYTSALLHDMGKLALAHACADRFEVIRSYQADRKIGWRQAEHDILGYDHTDVSGVLMELWDFPVSLIQVGCYYPRPRLAGEAERSLVTHVHAAKHLAISLGYGVGEEGFSTELDEALLLQEGFTPELFDKILPDVHLASEKAISGTFAGMD